MNTRVGRYLKRIANSLNYLTSVIFSSVSVFFWNLCLWPCVKCRECLIRRILREQ